MNTPRRQRGSLIITAILLIVVVALLASAVVYLFVEDERASIDYLDATSALFIAESGVEKGMRELSLDSNYTGEGPTNFGAGNFTVSISNTDANGNALPADQRRILSQGNVIGLNTASRNIEATIRSLTTLINEPFITITNWPDEGENPIRTCPSGNIGLNTQGTISLDADTAPGSPGGSFEAEIITKNVRRTGYRQQTLSPSIAANTPIVFSLEYKKIRGSRRPDVMMAALDLVSTGNDVNRIWSDCDRNSTVGGWVSVPNTAFTIPAGQTIDRIRISYDLDNPKNGADVTLRIDDIILSLPGGTILSWREPVP